jgi:hypothetical protein
MPLLFSFPLGVKDESDVFHYFFDINIVCFEQNHFIVKGGFCPEVNGIPFTEANKDMPYLGSAQVPILPKRGMVLRKG